MTKTIVILACFCASFTTATAQQNYLKLYLGFELANRPTLKLPTRDIVAGPVYQGVYETQPFYAVAFAREKANGNFWELSGQTNAYLGSQPVYDFSSMDSTLTFPFKELGKHRNNYAQLQFEYNWLQGSDKSMKVIPYLGLFLRASSQWASFEPSTSENFPVDTWVTSLSPGVVPRLLLKTNKRWRLDLSIPVKLGSISFERNTYGDPALTHAQQRSSIADMSMFNLETQIRLGFAYSLNKAATSAQ